MMRQSMNDQGQLDQQMVTSASAILNENNTDQLIHYVWDHWDDPIDAIQHKVKVFYPLFYEYNQCNRHHSMR